MVTSPVSQVLTRMKRAFRYLVPVLVLVLGGCSAEDDDVVTIRFAHTHHIAHPVHDAVLRFQQELAERSDGGMRLLIYPNEVLGTERECVELIQLGALDMTKISSAVLEVFQEEYKTFGLPFLFSSGEHMWNVLEGEIGEEILHSGRDRNLLGVGFYDAGARSFYTTDTRITHPDDLAGLQIRVQQSEMAIRTVSALGARPTPVSWGELYSALQQGIVDGAENNPPSFVSSNHYLVSNYFTVDEHFRLPDVIVLQTDVYERLSEDQREIFREALAASIQYQREIWEEAEERAFETVNEAGVEVIFLDREEAESFRRRVQGIHEDFQGTRVGDLAERIREADTD